MSDRNYAETGWPDWTPTVSYVTADTAKRKAIRAFWRGSIFGAILATGAFIASAAWSETIEIGGFGVYGRVTDSTTVTIEPSDVPGEWAVVTLRNQLVNDGGDTGQYDLPFNGMVIGLTYQWDADPLLGSDGITLTPPDGIICIPDDCAIIVQEGQVGTVTLLDWRGM